MSFLAKVAMTIISHRQAIFSPPFLITIIMSCQAIDGRSGVTRVAGYVIDKTIGHILV